MVQTEQTGLVRKPYFLKGREKQSKRLKEQKDMESSFGMKREREREYKLMSDNDNPARSHPAAVLPMYY